MANWMQRIARLGCIFLFAVATMVPAASAIDLEVVIAGLRSQNGSVLVALYKGPETYLKKGGHHQIVIIPADSALPLGVIRNLPPGQYSIAALHDENDNRKMDTRFRLPKEGLGFSNNVKVRFRAPSFADTMFEVGGERTRIEVEIRYR